ncbi:cytochrome [Sesamum angolense]|uniref:Cytochrome n=1 Tax=Sesamum angolense TaxID=2727404 RepID=A0AAE2BKP2_9LAMI|nr:cytochrome [Sesamum angolense]
MQEQVMEIQLPFSFTTLLLFSSFIFLLIRAWKKLNSPKKYEKIASKPPRLPVMGTFTTWWRAATPWHSVRDSPKVPSRVLYLKLGEFVPVAKNVKSFGSIRQDEVSRLIKSLQSSSGEAINLTEKVFAFTSSITCRAAFGKVMRDRDMLIAMLKKAVTMAGGFELADLFPSSKLLHVLSWNKYKLLRMRRKLDMILDVILEEHKLKQSGEFGGEDIVDVLLRMQKNGELQFFHHK